jgi:hypothetical protein
VDRRARFYGVRELLFEGSGLLAQQGQVLERTEISGNGALDSTLHRFAGERGTPVVRPGSFTIFTKGSLCALGLLRHAKLEVQLAKPRFLFFYGHK